MSTLIKRSAQGWEISHTDDRPNWKTPQDWQQGEPLLLQVDAEIDARFLQASTIAIDFPAFTDGRGLSLAVLLRQRIKYTGELHAIGAIHEDVLHYMVRCGFDVLELPQERCAETALRLLAPYTQHYQESVEQA